MCALCCVYIVKPHSRGSTTIASCPGTLMLTLKRVSVISQVVLVKIIDINMKGSESYCSNPINVEVSVFAENY